MARAAKILVVGAGFFGRLLIRELLKFTDCRVRIGGRDRRRLEASCGDLIGEYGGRIECCTVELSSIETVDAALRDVSIAICAAGPFQELPLHLVEACAREGVAYVDMADDREFVRRVRERFAGDRSVRAAICCGWSAVPALSGVMARIAAEGMSRVDAIHIQIAPGNRAPRANGTVGSLLASVGQQFTIWRDGAFREVSGWSLPKAFAFPRPVGRRVGYLVNVPDYDLFPAIFGAGCVEFRVGAEIEMLNRLTSVLAWMARHGVVRSWTGWTPLIRSGMAILGWLGHDWGAVGVEVSGERDGMAMGRRVCVVADHFGHRIPVMPAVILAERLLAGCSYAGCVAVDSWLSRDELAAACGRRGYRLTVEDVVNAK